MCGGRTFSSRERRRSHVCCSGCTFFLSAQYLELSGAAHRHSHLEVPPRKKKTNASGSSQQFIKLNISIPQNTCKLLHFMSSAGKAPFCGLIQLNKGVMWVLNLHCYSNFCFVWRAVKTKDEAITIEQLKKKTEGGKNTPHPEQNTFFLFFFLIYEGKFNGSQTISVKGETDSGKPSILWFRYDPV